MGSKSTHIVFRGIAKNGLFIHDHPELYKKLMESYDGKRVEMVVTPERRPKTISQMGYYFGGIIEATCMTSTVFEGWSKDEIHTYLLTKLRSYIKEILYPDGHREYMHCHDNLTDYDQEEMKVYVDDVISFLSASHGLVVLDPSEYKYEKYVRNMV